jgi:cytochrome c-type biogenesis protein CcmH
MVMFWLAAIAMAAVAIAIVLMPLRYSSSPETIRRDEINARIFRDRLAELDAERREGRVDDNQYKELRSELERTLLVDIPRDSASPRAARHNGILLGVATLLPILGLGYYYADSFRGAAGDWIGLRDKFRAPVERALLRPESVPPEAEDDPIGFTLVLQSHLLADGLRDPDGLWLLGNRYLSLQAPGAALTSLERAHGLAPERTDIALAYARAMMATQDGRLTQASAHLISRVLREHPDHQGALMLFGFGAFRSGLYDEAIGAWDRLLALREPDSEGFRLLRVSIDRARELRDRRRQQTETAASDDAGAKTANPSDSVEGSPQIAVTVDLSPDLAQRLAPEDTLFIFAKAAQGPPMPLAAVRRRAEEFPVQVVLNDSQAMLPSMKLSDFQEVVVGARISKAGDVMAKSGDLQGLSERLTLAQGAQSVSVVIDEVVP